MTCAYLRVCFADSDEGEGAGRGGIDGACEAFCVRT